MGNVGPRGNKGAGVSKSTSRFVGSVSSAVLLLAISAVLWAMSPELRLGMPAAAAGCFQILLLQDMAKDGAVLRRADRGI